MGLPQHIEYITDEHGNKKAVVLPVEIYEEILQDIQDLAALAERKDEPSVPLDEAIASLRKGGLL
jgi:hypothetical protein